MTRAVRVLRLGHLAVMALAGVGVAAMPAFAADAGKKTVTFAKDVVPILQQKCQVCHRPGTVAPMSLLTYEDARPWARAIKQRVALREMPPWHLDKTVGIQKYKNNRSLTDEQIATIVGWVDAGAPLGDPKDLLPPVQFQDEDRWSIGKPDLIVSTPDHVMYANGPDWWIDYFAETGLTEDRYIKAVETKPSKDGRRIVHHAITNLLEDESAPRAVDRTAASADGPVLNPAEGTYISEYAVGKYGDIFPENTGRMLKKGTKIRWNMHYHAIGEEVRDKTSVAFVFYPRGVVPKYYVTDVFPHENDTIDIPPGAVTRTDTYYQLPRPARIIAFQPHMHIRGKAQCMEAIHLDGQREMLSCVDRWDFNWHVAYHFEDDVTPLLPSGTVLHLISIHDNSAKNPRNPDPTIWVGWGQRSIDDMAAAHISTEFLTDEDFQRLVAERKAKQASN